MAQVIKIEIPVDIVNNSEPALSNIIKGLFTMDNAAKKTQKSLRSMTASDGGSRFERSYQKAMASMRSLMTAGKQRYQSVMELKDRVSPAVKKIASGLKSVAGKTWRVTMKAADFVTAPVRKAAGFLSSPLMAAGVSLSAGALAGDAIGTYAGFTSQMSEVKAIAGATQTEFAQLTDKAKEMGATTKFTAQESAEAFNYMGMAGWKASDMLGGIEGVLNLAAASGENLGTTSDIVTDALTAFGMKASDSTHFSDVLATAASNANTTVSGMGDTFKYVGSMAGALGYSIEDVALATGLMANIGVKGTMAGTALNAIMTRLSTNTNGATDTLRAMGVEFFNADGSARALSTVMGELRTATAGMTAEQKLNLANTVAGMEAQKGLLAILNASEEDYNKLSTAIENADGASKRMADTMLDNLSGKFAFLKNAVDGVKIAFGERVQPYLMDGLDWLIGKMPAVQDALMRGVDKVEAFAGSIKEKVAGFTSTSEWENAGLFGKIHIAWDELIGQPLSDWWNGDGKAKVADMAHDIGAGLGTGLSDRKSVV